MELLTGNQTGALLIQHRLTKLKELGWIPAAGAQANSSDGAPGGHAYRGTPGSAPGTSRSTSNFRTARPAVTPYRGRADGSESRPYLGRTARPGSR